MNIQILSKEMEIKTIDKYSKMILKIESSKNLIRMKRRFKSTWLLPSLLILILTLANFQLLLASDQYFTSTTTMKNLMPTSFTQMKEDLTTLKQQQPTATTSSASRQETTTKLSNEADVSSAQDNVKTTTEQSAIEESSKKTTGDERPQQEKLAIILRRPSIEEMASELSRKHLNLEHENWRRKQQSPTLSSIQPNILQRPPQQQQPPQTTATQQVEDVGHINISLTSGIPLDNSSRVIESELEISRMTSVASDSVVNSTVEQQEAFSHNKLHDRHRDHYLQIDSAAAAAAAAASVTNHPKITNKQNSQRRKKGNFFHSHNNADNELYQCHRYLQQHGSPPTNINSLPPTTNSQQTSRSSASSSTNQLPCSCEFRRTIDVDSLDNNIASESTWLSCDNVQLIGSHFYTFPNMFDTNTSTSQEMFLEKNQSALNLLNHFSQRDSGLQTLHSQKFHYLLLFNLKYIDLSNNRIRQIKMDAFHGLENKLEYLNLENNLLGDSRVVFDDARISSNRMSSSNSNNNNAKLIFLSDELNRLKKLKWLSLRNNQINQLGSHIFTRPLITTSSSSETISHSSELIDLNLSENLLKSVPSDSIQLLNKLQRLDLRRNRIIQLDQFSKFPTTLKYLDLSENAIKLIRNCDLIDLPDLVELNLSQNQLSRLDKTAFVSSSSRTLLNTQLIHNQDEKTRAHNTKLNDDQVSLINDANKESLLANNENYASLHKNGYELNGPRQRRHAREESEEELSDDVAYNDDLIGEESAISSSINNQLSANRQTMSDELNSIQQGNQFNSTQKLNLSYNFFEQLPGDSLLKFSNLKQLDLSYNRIRRFDSNYLCSIYNLVENLKELDLRGNLIRMPNANSSSNSENIQSRQLNRLFGCLQKLEKLFLATNRLGAEDRRQPDENTNEDSNKKNSIDDRLVIKFGETYGSKLLNTLDLSDNQLKVMPRIEQFSNQPSFSANSQNSSSQQLQLNQWIHSRSYIEYLNLNYNYLSRLDEHDFEHLLNLRELYLDYNRLTHLPSKLMSRFTSLDRLSINGNKISYLDPLNELLERSIRTLRVLNLANNRILEWPVISKPTALDINGASSNTAFDERNYFHQAQVALNFALEELNLEGNLLTSANVTSLYDQLIYMKSLRTLNLSYNLLNRIHSEWFKFANKNIRRLYLTGNKINNIDLGSFAVNQVDELLELRLDYNLLKELKRKTFDSLPKLRELNLANNLIHTINSETFYQVNSLQILRLNNNKLSSWKCEYFSHLCNSLSGNINADLNTLLQSDINNDEVVPPTVSSLIELDLSHNSLSQLRANSISVHTRLTRLNLEHNKLSFIPHDLFKATTAMTTSNRQIQLVSSLKYLNLAHNRIQTIDNINFRPLKNLLSLDLSYNELQTLGVDIVLMDSKNIQREQTNRKIIISSNLTNLVSDDEMLTTNQTSRQQSGGNSFLRSTSNWPALNKLRHLNIAHNQLTIVNQSLLSELSPFALLNLNLSNNYLDSESLPYGFYTKVTGAPNVNNALRQPNDVKQVNYDLVFTLKLESLDLSHNRLNEFPNNLLDNHYTSMESCNLAFNRIQNLIPNSNLLIQIKSLNIESNPLSRESNELVLFEQRSARYLNMAATRLYAIQQATSTADQIPYSTSVNSFKNRLANQTSQLDLIRSISRPIDAPFVRHLNLSSNQLVWLATNVFNKMHSLQTLDLSNNQLTRLHLLNNQLSQVSSTLEYLNMASNLFTDIDANDFSQLSKVQYLDLSNLQSLQKLNCKFLSRMSGLRTLKMLNYPQLRQSLSTIVSNINSDVDASGRVQKKLQYELLMSTVGKHCFGEELSFYETNPSDSELHEIKWYNLESIEVELFNNFNNPTTLNNGFRLKDELSQIIGPKTERLTITGLNLTQISDDSLFGITGSHLDLKISFTSLTQLPLKQILNSIAKRTKLSLDFRNNNIQSVDTKNIQLLDELQSNNQILEHGDYSSLKLNSNPMRCDCQTRPLWLWLNRGRVFPEVSVEDIAVESPQASSPGYWMKLNGISQASDMTCYYPNKLRGKLTQYVYYNDLVCKGSSSPLPANRQSRKKNDTRSSESYYPTILLNESSDTDELSEDDYLELESRDDIPVRLTKFNRFPLALSNNSLYFLTSVPVPFVQDEHILSHDTPEDVMNRIGKRDQNSNVQQSNPSIQPISIQYSKHRPNTQQRHSHYSTLNAFDQIPLTKNLLHSRNGQPSATKYSILTDSDVMILTVLSIAMTIMSFIIITICLFKYKFDQSGKAEILNTHNKLFMAHAVHLNNPPTLKISNIQGSSSGSSSNSSRGSRSKNADMFKNKMMTNKQCRLYSNDHILVPINSKLEPITQNFLMRSPTIRRMHALATNPTDWFKFAMRAQPPLDHNQRRRLFIGNKSASRSQMSASQLLNSKSNQFKRAANLMPSTLATGCPLHAFKIIRRLDDRSFRTRTNDEGFQPEDHCKYCKKLLKSIQQTKVQYVVRATQDESTSSSDINSSDISSQKKTKSLPERFEKVNGDRKVIETSGSDGKINLQDDQTQPCYIPPSLIKAIAKQIDQQQRNLHSQSNLSRSKWYQNKSNEVVHTRDQQMKSMKTFGVNASSNSMLYTKIQDPEIEGPHQSQLPTVDVDGRFTYQTESQLDSSMFSGSIGRGSLCLQRNETTPSTSMGGQENIFVLVQDSSCTTSQHQPDQYEYIHCAEKENSNQIASHGELSSMTNDECSHSSSPVAYGFMRSSPSGTTLSSNNNHARIERKIDAARPYLREMPNDELNNGFFGTNPNANALQNNNNTDYKVSRKEDAVELVLERDDVMNSSKGDDHIIISRL